ncbi:hypothetical protein FZEAL_6668 [Fusarium zealandicum]|uniref:Uncharacterized protein n=1 Tax=Fusarium zealandicum TaxID=1053134 RepID=A0A8H4UHC9_9HYPO|nr:hypothetical protein FZEAL_6668 [Fusarium zealandicum]
MSRDLAFSPHGWAYDTGREGRVKNLVVRIRNDGPVKTKNTLSIEVEPRHSQWWTFRELETNNVPEDELVVVVGELLPENAMDPTWLRKPSGILSLLFDRKYGLGRISPLPAPKENEDRIVYYSEWARNVTATQSRLRRSGYNANVNDFSNMYRANHPEYFIEPRTRPATPEIQDGKLTLTPIQTVVSQIPTGIAMYDDAGGSDIALLKNVRYMINSDFGRVNPDSPGDEMRLKIIQNMVEGKGPFDMEDAQEVVESCKALWSTIAEVNATAIHELAKGLRDGVKESTLVPKPLYRCFITMFCVDYARTHPKKGPSDAVQPQPPLAATPGSPDSSIQAELQRMIRIKTCQLEATKTRRMVTYDTLDLVKLLKSVKASKDINYCRNSLVRAVERIHGEGDAFVQEMVLTLENELKALGRLGSSLGPEMNRPDNDVEMDDQRGHSR